jgi:dGTPase
MSSQDHVVTHRLAPFAASDYASRGRRYPEPPPGNRGEFQRDRDRIIHCAAFRRLEYKTQVFVNHEGDLFRTRLTHSIEVSQIARSVARVLGLNEDLTETISLAHDLGHTPFGHAGQDALNACMKEFGGFEHNLQSLRVVDVLEERYAEFPGLNLTFESREGILKHCSVTKARELGELGNRFLERLQPSLEAQLVNLADEIAYNHHDIDDGLRSQLLTIEQLREVALFARHYDRVHARYPELAARRTVYETLRRMINEVVGDLIATSENQLDRAGVNSIDDVRHHDRPLIGYSDEIHAQSLVLKRFLRRDLYAHERVRNVSEKAASIITGLFDAFMDDPGKLPPQFYEKVPATAPSSERARVVADYIAGMTDRYAYREHTRLGFGSP